MSGAVQFEGTATVLGDDIDTDIIFPARYLAVLRPEEQARHLFEPLGESLRQRVIAGGVIAAGWNFGCGSSREHAVPPRCSARACGWWWPSPSPASSFAMQ